MYKDKSNKGGEGDQRGNRKKFMPNLEGTPIDTVGRRRGGEDKANDHTREERERSLEPTAHGCKAKSNKGGEGDQRGNREKSTKKLKKSPRKSLDDKLSRQSKKTRLDDEASSPADAPGDGKTANLEAIKGSLRKKGSGTPTHKGSEKTKKKTAMFTEAVSKGATEKSAPAITHKKCVVAFLVRVNKGKDTQAAFGKKIIAALSFLQTHIDKQAAFFAINGLVSDRPPIKEKADLPGFQVILRSYLQSLVIGPSIM